MKNDALGDALKLIESQTETILTPKLPVYARLDGRSFSKFTKGLERPFDERLSKIMIEVVKQLVTDFKPDVGYTQSDEISLGWGYRPDEVEFSLFSGRVQKLTSSLAAKATAKFMQLCYEAGGELRYRAIEMLPTFDARVCQPFDGDVSENDILKLMFEWREQDCRRNSVSMAARAHFSHKQCQSKSTRELLGMLSEADIDFQSYPNFFKRGTYVRRENFEVKVNPDIPLRYQPESGTVIRSRVVEISNDIWNDRFSTFVHESKNEA